MTIYDDCFGENDSNNRQSWVDSLLILCMKLKNIDCSVTIFGIISGSLNVIVLLIFPMKLNSIN
jgi:hypothetical protein